jgi:hypothetical protein
MTWLLPTTTTWWLAVLLLVALVAASVPAPTQTPHDIAAAKM